jgi:LysM repeat protein
MSFLPKQGSTQDFVSILMKSNEAVDRYSDLEYYFEYKERRPSGKIIEGKMDVRVQERPIKKVYLDVLTPDKAKLSYIANERDGKVDVKKGFLSINLAPSNSLLIENSHHPIYRSGFKRTRDILMTTYYNRKDDISSMAEIKGDVTYNGRSCYHVVLTDSKYGTKKYKVKAGDNLLKIAEKEGVPEIRIIELNDDIDDYFDIEEGLLITIPTSYGEVTTLYIDKENYLPLYQKVEDDLGLFAEYEILNLNLNPGFTASSFDHK